MVSVERRWVTAVGSGRPVNAATRRCTTVVVVVGDVLGDADVVVVVVVVSAPLTLVAIALTLSTAARTRGKRRMAKTYFFEQPT
jgi:hypothetical protein